MSMTRKGMKSRKPISKARRSSDVTNAGTITALGGAAERAREPLRDFLLKHTGARDRATFHALALKMRAPEDRAGVTDRDLAVIVPAFVTSELRRAFEIGFLLFLPFLIIDLVVASVLMSMGMMMLPPATISLPFKLIFFVLVDGWRLVAGSLVESFHHGVGVT